MLGANFCYRDGVFSATPATRLQIARLAHSTLKTGMAPADIEKKVDCSTNLVYVVKSTRDSGARGPGRPRGAATKRGPGRPPKTAAVAGNGLDSVIAAVRQSEQEHAKLVAAIQRIRGILDEIA